MSKEKEALAIATSHQFLGEAKGPRLVDARENADGTISIFVNGSDKETYRLEQRWIDINGQEVVARNTSVV